MTDKEIKELAEKCALYYQGSTANKGYNMNNRLNIEAYAKTVLKWLSDRFCIVGKEKINAYMEASKVSPLDSIDLIEIFNDLFGEDIFTDKDEKQ